MQLPDGLPEEIDLSRPSAARVYDYFLPDPPSGVDESPARYGAFGGVGRHDHATG